MPSPSAVEKRVVMRTPRPNCSNNHDRRDPVRAGGTLLCAPSPGEDAGHAGRVLSLDLYLDSEPFARQGPEPEDAPSDAARSSDSIGEVVKARGIEEEF
jgi:hypothetical protein